MTALTTASLLARRCAVAIAAVAALAQAPSARAAVKGAKPKAPIALAAPKSFDAAVAAVEKATGAKAADLELNGKILLATEGRSFSVDGSVGTRLLEGSHEPFLKAGFYLFRHERSFGLGGSRDTIGLVASADREALVRRVGTADPGKKVTTDQIVAWLAALEKDEPFALTEVGHDFVAGIFKAVPKDPAAVAKRCAELAPELTKGSGSAIDLLAEEIKVNRTLYLIW